MPLEYWLEQDQDQYGDPEPDLVLLDADRVRFTEGELAESAELGEVAIGGITFDDPDGTLDVVGWRHFRVYETDAPADNQLVYRGRIWDRTYRRGPRTGERSSIRLGPGRIIVTELSHQNVNLTRRLFTGNDANRPAETAGERLAWLIAEPRFPGYDFGHVEYPTDNLDANDYRGRNSRDILGDIAIETGSTYWLAYNEVETANELFFMDPNSADYVSTIRVSNDLDDVDLSGYETDTFMPLDDAEVKRSPSRIAYGVYLPYRNGSVYVQDEDTGIAFARVDRAAPMADVKSSTRATRLANKLLADNDEEDDRVFFAIRVPAAQVNDLRIGHRFVIRLLHVPGWMAWRSARVLRRTVRQDIEADAGWYLIRYEATPIAEAPVEALFEGTMDVVGDPPGGPFSVVSSNSSSGFLDTTSYNWSITVTYKSGISTGYAFSWRIGENAPGNTIAVQYSASAWGMAESLGPVSSGYPQTATVSGSFTTAGGITGKEFFFQASEAIGPHDTGTIFTWTWSIEPAP